MASIALPPELARLAATQHGILSGSQLLAARFTRDQISYRLTEGVLARLAGDTFIVAGAPLTYRATCRAATLAVPDGVLAVRAASSLHGFPRARPAPPEIFVSLRAGHEDPGVRVRRRGDLLARHRCVVDGIPCTTVPRTVLDLAAELRRCDLEDLVDDLVGAGRLSIPLLFDEFDRIARRGRNGTTAMRAVLESRLDDLIVPASKLHRVGLSFLERHGFPPPDVEFTPPWAGPAVGRVDVAYPRLRIVIEFDGRRWHDRSDRFEHDRLRDQLALAAGWIVVRVTWRQLHADPAGLAARLRETFAHRSLG